MKFKLSHTFWFSLISWSVLQFTSNQTAIIFHLKEKHCTFSQLSSMAGDQKHTSKIKSIFRLKKERKLYSWRSWRLCFSEHYCDFWAVYILTVYKYELDVGLTIIVKRLEEFTKMVVWSNWNESNLETIIIDYMCSKKLQTV